MAERRKRRVEGEAAAEGQRERTAGGGMEQERAARVRGVEVESRGGGAVGSRAINYVRELEQLLQSLEVQKSIKNNRGRSTTDAAAFNTSPFAGFFSFPQYSTSSSNTTSSSNATTNSNSNSNSDASGASAAESARPAAVADIEVTMVEGHASLKVLARRRPKQLLKLVAGLHQLRIPPLHLNMTTTADAMVLYTFSLKVEDDSKMGSVEDIATAVHEILGSIQRQQEEEETAVM